MALGRFFKRLAGGDTGPKDPLAEVSDADLDVLWCAGKTATTVTAMKIYDAYAARARPFPRAAFPPAWVPAATGLEEAIGDFDLWMDRVVAADPRTAEPHITIGEFGVLVDAGEGWLAIALPGWRAAHAERGAPEPTDGRPILGAFAWDDDSIPEELGDLAIEQIEGGGLRLSSGLLHAVIGPRVPLLAIMGDVPTHFVGGIRAPITDEESAGATATGWTNATAAEVESAWVLGEAAGVDGLASLSLLGSLFITPRLVGSGRPIGLAGQELLSDAKRPADPVALMQAIPSLLLATENTAEAIETAMDLVVRADNSERALVWKGMIALAQGDAEAATGHFEAAAQNDPPSMTGLAELAAVASRAGDAEGALALMRKACESELSPPAMEAELARALWICGETDEAAATAQASVPSAESFLGHALEAAIHDGDAAATGATLLGAVGTLHGGLDAARALMAGGCFDAAERLLGAILAQCPHHPEAEGLLITQLVALERDADALALCDAALLVRPWFGALRRIRADLRVKAGDSDGAREDLADLLELFPDDNESTAVLALLHERAGAKKAALRLLTEFENNGGDAGYGRTVRKRVQRG